MSAGTIQMIVLTLGLIALTATGLVAQRQVKGNTDMAVGGRTFNRWNIFFGVFAFWGGSTIASIIELSHKNGIVSGWFGISRALMFVIIMLVSGGAFRRLSMITLPDFVATRYGSRIFKMIGGTIICFNFTIFSISSVVAAAAFFTGILGWNVWVAVIFTVISFLTYTLLGGMFAIAYNGRILAIGQLLTLVVGVCYGVYTAGWDNIMALPTKYFTVLPDSHVQTVMMWFFTFIINAFVAQAALQIVMSCKTVREGQKGLFYVVLGFIPIIIFAPLIGMSAKVMFPDINSIQAMPMLASSIPSVALSSIVVLGFYFTTLAWAASCILSGGTVAANDVYRFFKPDATSQELVKVTRIAIAIIAALTVGAAGMIPSGVAFWQIVGFVVRNAALFPLIMAGLFWNMVSKKVAVVAAISGSTVGAGWYVAESAPYLLNAHPMFIGMMSSMLILTAGTLIDHRKDLCIQWSTAGKFFLGAALLVIALTVFNFSRVLELKIQWPCISTTVALLFLSIVFTVKNAKNLEKVKKAEETKTPAVKNKLVCDTVEG